MSDRQIRPYSELMPAALADKVELAKYLSQSQLMPKGMSSPAQVVVALVMGHELGLTAMVAVNNIAVINGRPSLSSAIKEAIVRNHPGFSGQKIEFAGDYSDEQNPTRSCTVTIRRKFGENIETFEGYFDMAMARTAGLWPGKKDNWDKYPDRMLKARASGYASNDAMPDALAGMMSWDEAEDVPPEPRDVTPPRDVRPEKAPDDVKKGGNNVDIPIDQLIKMLTPEELKAIDDKLAEVQAFIQKNMKYLKAETVQFVNEHARENCIRRFYRIGTDPTKYLDEMWDRMRKQVDDAKAKEKDTQKKEAAEKGQQPAGRGTTENVSKTEGTLMDEVKAKAAQAEDAEVVEEEPPEDFADELDIF